MPDSYRSKLDRLVRNELDPSDFAHVDHLGVAYEALAIHGYADAVQKVYAGIRAMAERAGAPEKANATITWAFMSLIAERMHTMRYANAEDFIARNPDLRRGDAIAQWYSPARLRSDLARTVALLPDRTPAV